MIWKMYAIYNKKVNAFERPVITFHEKDEFVEVLKRDYYASDNVSQAKLQENICYYLGEYDDNTGEIKVLEKEFLIDLSVLSKPNEEKDNA